VVSTILVGKIIIPFLIKLKFGQQILEIGPSWHKEKQGTPTMGGVMFIVGIIVATLVGVIIFYSDSQFDALNFNLIKVISAIFMAIGFSAIGFVDDYVKILKKQNEGLTAKQKLFLQILVAVSYLYMLNLSGETTTSFKLPFLGEIDFGYFYYLVSLFIIIAMVNAVNLTDGLDGLAACVTFFVAISLMFISTYLTFFFETIMSTALAAGCLGFLVYNFYPAKVFMGDTGSMFLGAFVTAICFNMGYAFILPVLGVIYFIENLSVILQVISFKTTGKRIFKMSPIHHHFEMSGYSEVKIVILFSLVTMVGGLLSFMIIYNGFM
ncbi:MAG: phospho-N-acetylmuramoyl-pentapeptide-transferase, partial [Oscillospiraceae bacterium]